MVIRVPRLMSRALPFLLLLIATGCAPLEKRVDLTYQRFVNATGGSGQIFVTRTCNEAGSGGTPLRQAARWKSQQM